MVNKHINDSLDIQKTRFNKGRKNVHYFVTDKVLKKPHVLSDAAKGISAKLEPVYKGPYTITDVIAPYVYKLDMGDSRKIEIVKRKIKRKINRKIKKKK